ncbi:MAG: hypothetical protein BHW64_05690 [Candidatus Melainabacteria bacterium LEY3_CP_29_8]|nr:MAG: hypothetical protein BHW64_05690 [Candidatus Melainabacteria bacterium LEY3_CP_29_8]
MIANDSLEIILVTYNRKKFPIRHLDITILDNNSNDGTFELIKNYQAEFPNLQYIKNPCNIGGGANVVKAFTLASKKYIWVLCDDDTYDFDGFEQIEKAMNEGYDAIFTRPVDNKTTDIYSSASFVPGCIYKTENITETVICNMYDNISNMFPHLALIAKNINDNNKYYIPAKDHVKVYTGNYDSNVYIRGYHNKADIPLWRKNMFLYVGFLNSLYLINSDKKRNLFFKLHVASKKNIFSYINSYLKQNFLIYNNSSYNLFCLFKHLSYYQKIIFMLILIVLYIKAIFYYNFCNKEFLFMQNDKKWQEYLTFVNEQRYIDKLAKKYNNKKILIYGTGTIAEHIFDNYDLSKLNIIAVSDKKYTIRSTYKGYLAVSPDEIKDLNPDIILFTLYSNKPVKDYLKKQNIDVIYKDLIKREKYILI